jgi:hypothetical protein
VCFLYMKTIERAHTPSKVRSPWAHCAYSHCAPSAHGILRCGDAGGQMWEKIKLPANYSAALALIDQQLQHSPKFQIHKCKQVAPVAWAVPMACRLCMVWPVPPCGWAVWCPVLSI